MRKDSTYHSRSPHRRKFSRPPSRPTLPASALNTPSWQVTEDSTRTVVLTADNGRSSGAPGQEPCPDWPIVTERIVKNIANRAAKNISSDDSQTIVPTLTRLGRFARA